MPPSTRRARPPPAPSPKGRRIGRRSGRAIGPEPQPQPLSAPERGAPFSQRGGEDPGASCSPLPLGEWGSGGGPLTLPLLLLLRPLLHPPVTGTPLALALPPR